jgi:hypothetical protein
MACSHSDGYFPHTDGVLIFGWVLPSYAHGVLIFEWVLPSYADGVLQFSCRSLMLMTSPTLMTFFYANARGIPERTETRGRSGEDGVDPERQKKTELAMAERLTKLTTKTQSKRLKVTRLVPSYAHMSSACEWEISIDGEGIASSEPTSAE